MEIRLNPNWSSSLAYEILDRPADQKPIFVGRDHLLDPLLADVLQTRKTGAYLISGYRGSGKTSLLIEVLHRARSCWPKTDSNPSPENPFVVVLNVSEVSASLDPATAQDTESITIDPRRLLIALLRSLRNRIHRGAGASGESAASEPRPKETKRASEALLALVSATYDKAIAANYMQASSVQLRQESSDETRTATELTLTAPYKVGGALAVVIALGIEAFAWRDELQPFLAHLLAAAAAVTAGWSLNRSRKLTQSLHAARTSETSLRFDNSLQQLENDLKDILELLAKEDFRTVVVLEELDKIDDEGGTQLDRVIRYFKNLFTQAPALFFFLADKAYFDLVESRIRDARGRRYYSLEHTFFTHRLYVNRPSAEDCLDYLRQAIAEERYRNAIDWLRGRDGAPEPSGDEELRFARFARAVLFRSANHLFDLKNELRRYVRSSASDRGGEVVLVIDESTLPEEEATLAAFQDLVEAKLRAYAFGRGRAYANEAMQDYLYGVFRDLGSALPQDVRSFHPRATVEVEVESEASAGGTRKTPIRTALEGEEIQRIGDAVDSLITDLQRGGAFQSFRAGTFVWRRNPARNFKLERQLEKHEQEFLHELSRLAAQLDFATPGHPLREKVPEAADLLSELQQEEKEIRQGSSGLTVDEALAQKDELQVRVERAVAGLYDAYLAAMKSRYGFDFDLIAAGPDGEALYRVRQQPTSPKPEPDPSRGVQPGEFEVYVAVGELESFTGMAPTPKAPLKRASVIQVTRRPARTARAGKEAWKLLHGTLPSPDASEPTDHPAAPPSPTPPTVSFDLLPLDEDLAQLPANADAQAWGDLLGDTILFRVHWVDAFRAESADDPQVRVAALREDGPDVAPPERQRFSKAVSDWLRGDHGRDSDSGGVLWMAGPPDRSVELVLGLLGGPEFVDVAPVHPVYFSDQHDDGLFLDARRLVLIAHPGPVRIGRAATGRLLARHRLIYLGIAAPTPQEVDQQAADELRQAVGFDGLAILAADKLAEELLRLGVTRVELP